MLEEEEEEEEIGVGVTLVSLSDGPNGSEGVREGGESRECVYVR